MDKHIKLKLRLHKKIVRKAKKNDYHYEKIITILIKYLTIVLYLEYVCSHVCCCCCGGGGSGCTKSVNQSYQSIKQLILFYNI